MNTASMMKMTLLALIPGVLAYSWVFGSGILINVLVAVITALAVDAAMLKFRKLPLEKLKDCTAVITGVLLGLCLPPLLPYWLIVLGVVFALIFGKHMYGGTGHNVFNPAMVGFAVLIISFPLAMSQWPATGSVSPVMATLTSKADMHEGRANYDGVTAATPLDAYKFRTGQTNQEFFSAGEQDNWQYWAIINIAFLMGGLFLIYAKVIPWQTPVAMLTTIGILAMLFYDAGSSNSLGSPLFHLFSGATMLAAFFIITDPVTCPGNSKGLLIFGAGVGLVTFIIRTVGAYPEGIAFAVLLMNASSPLIDHVLSMKEQPA
jgi:electron transport complex protein RnfD